MGGAAPAVAGIYARRAIPARYALERGAWAEAAALQPRTTPFPYADAITHFARALGAARCRQARPRPRADVAQLAALARHARPKAKDAYWTEQVDIQRQVATAWVTFAEGRKDEACGCCAPPRTPRTRTDKSAVSPGPLAPARELLGEMLLDAGNAKDALVEFEATMKKEPNRFRGGMARRARPRRWAIARRPRALSPGPGDREGGGLRARRPSARAFVREVDLQVRELEDDLGDARVILFAIAGGDLRVDQLRDDGPGRRRHARLRSVFMAMPRSFLNSFALNPGFKLPVIIRSPCTSSTRLCANPPISAARTFIGSTPDLRDSAIASATTAIVPPSTIWLHALQTCPAPESPTWTIFSGCPSREIAGRTASSAAASPPTMNASVPAMAPTSPPLTGASRN